MFNESTLLIHISCSYVIYFLFERNQVIQKIFNPLKNVKEKAIGQIQNTHMGPILMITNTEFMKKKIPFAGQSEISESTINLFQSSLIDVNNSTKMRTIKMLRSCSCQI